MHLRLPEYNWGYKQISCRQVLLSFLRKTTSLALWNFSGCLHCVQVHTRVLQNTIEQFIVSFVSQLVASTWLEPTQMAVIPIVVALFLVGRLLFWQGYRNPANNRTNRASGFPLTMFSSLGLIVFNVYKLITTWLSWLESIRAILKFYRPSSKIRQLKEKLSADS